jgi:hypothetical protein
MKPQGPKSNAAKARPKKKRVALSQRRLQALIAQGQLMEPAFDTTEAAKPPLDSADLRTEKDKVAMLLWVHHQ